MGGREEELCSVTRAEYIAIRWRGTSSERVCVCVCVPLFPGVGTKEMGLGELSFLFLPRNQAKKEMRFEHLFYTCALLGAYGIYTG